MKSLSIAFLVALVGIAAVFLVLSLAGVDKSVAGPIATAIMGGIPYIRESLEKRERLEAGNGAGSRILSLEGFGIPPARVVLYGTLILAAVMLVSSAFAGIIATASRVGTMEGNRTLVGAFALALVLPAQFLIGRWVGRRGAGRGILAVILVAAFGRLLIIVFDRAFMTSDEIAEFVGAGTATQLMAGVVLLSAIGLLGYWRGRRQRLAAYLSYLLKDVSEETRNAIVDLAYGEADRASKVERAAAAASGRRT